MSVRIRGDRVEQVALRIYEPPRFFEGFLRGRALHRAARHHRADLRDLPGRLPDELGRGDRGRLRCRRCPSRCGCCAGCSTAASGSRATCCTSSCSTRPTSSATTASSTMAQRPPRRSSRTRSQLKKAGNTLIEVDRRARDPPGQRQGRRLLPRPDARASSRPSPRRSSARGRSRCGWSPSPASSTFPDFEREYLMVALRAPGGDYADRARSRRLERGSRHRRRRVPGALRRAAGAALDGAALAARTASATSSGPLARFNLGFDRLSPLAREAALDAGVGPACRNPFQSIVVRAVEILYACDEALRLIERLRAARSAGGRSRAARRRRPRRDGGAARRPLPALRARRGRDDHAAARSCRRPRRTRRRSSTTWSSSSASTCDLDDEALTHRCEQAIRNYDPCISCATHFLKLEVDRA